MADVLSISGISGTGKTSLAKYVFERHRPTFHKSSFIEDVSKRCTEQFNGLIDLQKQLYGDISKTSSIQVHDVSVYTSKIGNALAGKKVLLVLDDIDNLDQLDALLGIKGLHPGSKIIITTKDASLTEKCPLVKPYKHTKVLLEGLNMVSSLQLLRFHAFQGIDLKDGYKQVSKKLSKLCEGHPLALKVLGRSLCDRDVAEWEEYIEELEKETDSHIKKVLRMSFDSLPSQNDKELFKHVACFFIGMDRDYTETILKACGICILLGTKNLLDRSLLTIGPSNELMMHQLLQEMGRDVVRQESFDKPWKRSRLWHHEESFRVLEEKKGKGNLLGLALDMRMFGKERLNGSYVLKTDALSKMYNLMLLQLNYVQMDGSYENFPEELRWLCMHGFPSKSIPSDLPMENLVVLDMSYSNIESFGTCFSNQPPLEGEQKQVIGSLKILDLSFCEYLHRLGGFIGLPALERLIVRNCISLIEICESLVECVELVLIDLSYCTKLENLPAAIGKLEKVKTLLPDGCNTCEPQKLIQRNKALAEVADVKRKYVKGSRSTNPQSSTVDPERAAFEEEIDKFTREKSLLEKSVMRFKQQQPTTKLHLEDLTQCVDSMEQKQDNLLTFFKKASQNPEFVEHLTQKLKSRDFSADNKKRRLPPSRVSPEDSLVDNESPSRPDSGNVFHHDFSNKLMLELSPAVSDINFVSNSTQSSNEDGGSPHIRLSENYTRTTDMTLGRLPFTPETQELSDTCTSFAFNLESSFMHKTVPNLDANEEPEGHLSCQLNLTLASSVSQIDPSQVSDTIPKSFEGIGKPAGENVTLSSSNQKQGEVVVGTSGLTCKGDPCVAAMRSTNNDSLSGGRG